MKTVLKALSGIAVLVVILLATGISRFVGKTLVDNYYAGRKDGTINKMLLKTANQVNSKLPIMVDANTRLDSTIGLNKQFRYDYTLVNYSSSQVSGSQLQNALGKKLINNVCTSKALHVFVKDGVTFSYAYFGNDGKLITIISVAPSQCGAT